MNTLRSASVPALRGLMLLIVVALATAACRTSVPAAESGIWDVTDPTDPQFLAPVSLGNHFSADDLGDKPNDTSLVNGLRGVFSGAPVPTPSF